MVHFHKKNKGFALVEVLIAITILTVVISPIIFTFVSSSKVNQKSKRVLSATEMAQNMFEAISSKKPEDSIVELSSLAMSPNVDLKEKRAVIPEGADYDNVYELKATKDPTGAITYADVPGGGSYVISKELQDAVANRYRCRGFQSDESGLYRYYITGLKQVDTYYDLRVTFDSSNYKDVYVNGTSGDPDYEKLVRVSGINPNYDGVFMESESELTNVVSLEYQNKRLNPTAGTASDILSRMRRTYTINIYDEGVAINPNKIVDVKIDYEYTRAADKAYSQELKLTGQEERLYEGATSPRNIFIYYVPNYYSRNGNLLDNFVINNMSDYNVNVYIIRTEQEYNTTFENANVTTTDKEKNYKANVKACESKGATINTCVRTNLSDNISKEYDKKNEDATDQIEYSIEVSDLEGLSQAEVQNLFETKRVEGIEAEKEKERVYDVTIEVFVGKSGGKGDHNGYKGYGGAYSSGFQDVDKLAEFTGTVVQ